MSRIEDLSPKEKRRLLVQILQKKARKRFSGFVSAPGQSEGLNQFATSVKTLNDDAVLDPSICPEDTPFKPVTEPTSIFLTGATGFLGIFLLQELLQQTQADIYCLVRCTNSDEGSARIQKQFETYLPEHEFPSSRIIPVVGDLSKPRFDLSLQQFQRLATQMDIIYHNGALVNWLYLYETLKPTNVLGTQEVLRLASQIKLKPLHYISTISVFPATVINSEVKVFYEQDPLDHGGLLYGGYSQSKWVAEKLVTIGRSKGLPISIYRPGIITGHSQTGAWNTNDVACRMIKVTLETGYTPHLQAATDMTPVDYVAQAIVHLSRQEQSQGKVFHLANPQPVHERDLVAWVRSFGYPLQQIPYGDWRAKMIDLAGRSEESPLTSVRPLFSQVVSEGLPGWIKRQLEFDQDTIDGLVNVIGAQYAAKSIRLDCQNALDGLADTSIKCPPVDAKLLNTYFSYLIRIGFLEPPRLKSVSKTE